LIVHANGADAPIKSMRSALLQPVLTIRYSTISLCYSESPS
jgi:hypothetical protein